MENSCGLTSPSNASAPVSDGLLRMSIFAVNPPKGGNHEVDIVALSTPGTSAIAFRITSFSFKRACHVGYAPCGMETSNPKTWSGS